MKKKWFLPVVTVALCLLYTVGVASVVYANSQVPGSQVEIAEQPPVFTEEEAQSAQDDSESVPASSISESQEQGQENEGQSQVEPVVSASLDEGQSIAASLPFEEETSLEEHDLGGPLQEGGTDVSPFAAIEKPPFKPYKMLLELKHLWLASGSYKNWNWATSDPVYYYTDSNGCFTLVSLENDKLVIYTFDGKYTCTATKTISFGAMYLWGGFYAAPDGNFYIVVGDNNEEQNDQKKVMEVRRFNRNWEQTGAAPIYGGSTHGLKGIRVPFRAGSCNMALQGPYLVVHTSRIMYTASDGLNHQSNITFEVDTRNMQARSMDSYGRGCYNYMSHSFQQLVRFDGGNLLMVDHGDAYPRTIRLGTVKNYSGGNREVIYSTLFNIQGALGDNYTGVTVTGFETGSRGNLVVGTAEPHDKTLQGISTGGDPQNRLTQNAYLIVADKNSGQPSFQWLSSYAPGDKTIKVQEPRLIKLGEDQFIVLFTVKSARGYQIEYRLINSAGQVQAAKTVDDAAFNPVSLPLYQGGLLQWLDNGVEDWGNGYGMCLYAMDVSKLTSPHLLVTKVEPEQVLTGENNNISLRSNSSFSNVISLTPQVDPPYATNTRLTWSSSNPQVAQVDSNGQVTALKPGRATITAKTHNDKIGRYNIYVRDGGTGWDHYYSSSLKAPRVHYYSNYTMATGWTRIDGQWYLFDSSGVLQIGWVLSGGCWYLMQEEGSMCTGWQLWDGKWYYLAASGALQVGWQFIDHKWYYLGGNGAMQSGWNFIDGKWYYLNGGAMHMGWLNENGKWYYMNAGGSMQTSWQFIGQKWYYFTASGAMQTGWLQSSSRWYYLNSSGIMQTGWVKLGSYWYYLNGSGVMQTGKVRIGSNYYTFNSNGRWIP